MACRTQSGKPPSFISILLVSRDQFICAYALIHLYQFSNACIPVVQGDDKKGTLAVQSLRNTLMLTILTATVTALITVALAALTNNAMSVNNLLSKSDLFGSQSARIMVLKFGSAAIFLVGSFLCSSMAVGCLIDANYLINAIGEFTSTPAGYTEVVFERGFMLAVVGNRVLCIAFPLLMWLFGPLPVAISSIGLVWALYGLDFLPKSLNPA